MEYVLRPVELSWRQWATSFKEWAVQQIVDSHVQLEKVLEPGEVIRMQSALLDPVLYICCEAGGDCAQRGSGESGIIPESSHPHKLQEDQTG